MMRAKQYFLPFLLLAVLGLGACSSPANRDAMVVGELAGVKQHERTVNVKTAGGTETNAMEGSNVSDPDFKAAIEASIVKNKVFRSVIQGKGADYDLLVTIVHVERPTFGLTFTVEMEATWVLIRQSDQAVVMKRSFKSSSTATFGDAAAAVTRLRLAVEGAARKNIEQGLNSISELSL